MDQLINLLNYLGITPSQIVPAVLVGGSFLWIVRKWFINNLAQDVSMIRNEVRDLHYAAKEMQLYLGNDGFASQHTLEQKPLYEQYGQHSSPMQPNPRGEKLLKDSHFYEMYEELQDQIFAKMDGMNLRTLYDYEAGASRTLFLLSNEPAMDKVKEYAVNHPEEQLDLIFGIASWIIRDDYAAYKASNEKVENKSLGISS